MQKRVRHLMAGPRSAVIGVAVISLSFAIAAPTAAGQASTPLPERTEAAAGAKQIAGGTLHTCAILDDDTVRCWGSGGVGQLGYGNTDTIGDDETPASVTPVDLGAGRTARNITAGTGHTCAILDDDTVRCWGSGGVGQLGYGNTDTIGDNETPGSVGPVDLGTGRTAKHITAGTEHTCAILDDDTVRCWGRSGVGQLGYGNTDTIGDNETPGSVGPVDLGTGRTAKDITAGTGHTCAILDDDTVRCWGNNFAGKLGYPGAPAIGDDETPGSVGPVDLGAGRTAKRISVGDDHTCAVLDDDTVRCWGNDSSGKLGYGASGNIGDDETPGSVGPVDLGAGRTAKDITTGSFHTCAVLDDDTIRCWGAGSSGRLGYGNTDSVSDPATVGPVDLGTGRNAQQITAGSFHTCAVLDDGTVRCWGAGNDGRLGYGNTDVIGDDETPGSVGVVDLGTTTANPCSVSVSDEAEYRAALLCADTAVSATTITLGADITIDGGTDPTYSGTEALTIGGDGHLLDAQTSSRVLNVDSPADLTVNSVRATGASTGGGGAIAAGDAVTISNSDFAGSAAANGGGAVLAQGPVTISGSTFRGNIADGGAGGGAVRGSGDVTITNSTFTGNDAANGGSAISAVGKVTVEHVTIADNTGSDQITADTLDATASVFDRHNDSGANCDIATASTSGAHNYATDDTCGLDAEDDIDDGDDPLLGQIRDNGATPTMYPLNGSPLIDAIPTGDCTATSGLDVDQRGVTRPFGAGCDIGAIEAVFPAHGFTDATLFFEPTIRWVTSTVNTPQILNGFPDNTFGQELNITRGQAARLYYRGAGSPDPLAQPPHGFSDVTPFYEDAVRWAKGVGLFNGYPDNTFRQGDPIARGEYIRSLYNFAGTQDVDAEGLDPHGLTDVTPFYEDAVRWAKAWGLANGFPDNTFRQTNNIKRGNAARTFYNTAQTPTAWADTMTAPDNMLFKDNLPDPPP